MDNTIAFPYASFEQGSKDAFKKIGGPEGAFTLMARGHKATAWRKSANKSRREREKRAMALLREHEAKQAKTTKASPPAAQPSAS